MLGIGIDIGSTATKIAVLDDGGAVVDVDVRPTGFSSVEAASAAGEYHHASQGLLDGPHAVVATSYGRIAVPFADKVVTEIACHGLSAIAVPGTPRSHAATIPGTIRLALRRLRPSSPGYPRSPQSTRRTGRTRRRAPGCR